MRTIDFSQFSDAHIDYMRKCIQSYISVAEGAVRSGKTVDHCQIAALLIEASYDTFHLATGSTLGNAKLNIGDCNGYGLQHLFKGRCRWEKYLDNEALFVQTARGQKIVIFAGAGKKDSYKKILGNSYGIWIATEVNNHYISEENDCFIDVAMNRLIASKDPHILWDLNPNNPHHQIYSKYIDVFQEKKEKNEFYGGYNYRLFTLNDNASLSEQQKQIVLSAYVVGSASYRRNILGQRVASEGLIFRMVADNPDRYMIDDFKKYVIEYHKKHRRIQTNEEVTYNEAKNSIQFLQCGVDFGGNGSATVFVCTAFIGQYDEVIPIEAMKLPKGKGRVNPDVLEKEFIKFLYQIYDTYGIYPKFAFCDSAEQVLINGLYKAVRNEGIPTLCTDCNKMTINGRIDFQMKMLNTGRMKISKNCQIIIDSLSGQVWDESKVNEDIRLDDGITADIDTADAFEYSFSDYIENYIFFN